jgi:3-phosphoshikimate 1-carboxyvinyltransferase
MTKTRSPWALDPCFTSAKIGALRKINQVFIEIPGSKSYTNRALLLASIAKGVTTLKGILKSDDSYWCIQALKDLGIKIELFQSNAEVYGCGAKWPKEELELYLGSGGTIARFLPGLLLGSQNNASWKLTASSQMTKRPIGELFSALTRLGSSISYSNDSERFPVVLKGNSLHGGEAEISGATSSQFLSGLLMAAPLSKVGCTIAIKDHIVQSAYVKITTQLMKKFSCQVEYQENLKSFKIAPQTYQAAEIQLEADASTSCYFLSLPLIAGGELTITNLTPHTLQPDIRILEIIKLFGGEVFTENNQVKVRGSGKIKGGFTINMQDCSDQVITVAVLAALADKEVEIRGVEHIRHHESDRISVVATQLKKLGCQVIEFNDGLKIAPQPMHGAKITTFDDHRIAMGFSILATQVPGIEIDDPGCVSKTCPSFYELLRKCGVEVNLASADPRAPSSSSANNQ